MRTRTLSALAALCLIAMHPAQAASETGLGAGYFASHDSESFSSNALSAYYLPAFTHGSDLTGVRATSRLYSQKAWRLEAHQLMALLRKVDPATANGWQLDAGLSQQGGHNTIVLDGSYHTPLAAKTGLDVFVNRDWVETPVALAQGIDFTFLGGAIDQGIGEHLTVVGIAGVQLFSDDNNREHWRARIVYQPMLDSGLTLQLRYRTFHSSKRTGTTYFNPVNYDETLLAAGWRKRIEGWVFRTAAGLGVQHVNNGPGSNTRLLELQLDSPYRGDQFVRLRGGHSRSASFGGADYSYNYLQGEWLHRF